MYKVNPQFKLPENIELPDCMYRATPINPTIKLASSLGLSNGIVGSTNNVSDEDKGSDYKNKQVLSSHGHHGCTNSEQLISEDKLNAIEERQLALISKLSSLHQLVLNLHEQERLKIKSNSNNIVTPTPKADPDQITPVPILGLLEEDFVDIVINADPAKPPYSILFFYKLLQQVFGPGSIIIKTHFHSSVSNVVQSTGIPATIAIAGKPNNNFKYLDVFNVNLTGIDSCKKKIIFTIIWKKLNQDVELLISPIDQNVICGEGNILRFLSRILPSTDSKYHNLNYDCLERETLARVDAFFDHNNQLRNLDSLEAHLNVLNSGSKSQVGLVSEYLVCGNEPTIADFLIYSISAQTLIKNEQLLSKYTNILKWLWSCQQYSGFSLFNI